MRAATVNCAQIFVVHRVEAESNDSDAVDLVCTHVIPILLRYNCGEQ